MMEDSYQRQGTPILNHTNRENRYYNVLGSLNYIIRVIDSSEDEKLKAYKPEILDIRERVEDSLLEVGYLDK